MRREFQIAVIAVAAVTWLVTALLYEWPTTWWDATRPFVTSMAVTSVVVGIYNHWAWRFKLFHGWLTRQPDLTGVWLVEMNSTYQDKKTGWRPGSIRGFAQIDQTGSTLCLRLYTANAKSKSTAYAFNYDQKVYTLITVYENEPSIEQREHVSPLHKGTSIFELRGHRPLHFSGDYWTERKTTGTVALSDRKSGEINSYQEGVALFAS